MSDAGLFAELRRTLLGVFDAGIDSPLDDASFNDLALRCFAYQFNTNPVYADFVRARGPLPKARWQEVPAVPTSGFKAVRLLSGHQETAERIFRTSGTTGQKRGEHHVMDLALYRGSLLPNFKAHLVPDEAELSLASLIPSPVELPDSSLSYMIGCATEAVTGGRACFCVDANGRIDHDGLRASLSEAVASGTPVLLAGTAFAFVHWMDALAEAGVSFGLPEGSRIMETGGFKGRSRTLQREAFYAELADRHGVPEAKIVNEYGMTELLSQFYEPVLRTGADPGVSQRVHVPPPWVRTRILDPVTLEELPDGTPGLLCHFDLANLGSVCAVLTEDMGVATGQGFRVLGRAPGAEPRGCSLAMDQLMASSYVDKQGRL